MLLEIKYWLVDWFIDWLIDRHPNALKYIYLIETAGCATYLSRQIWHYLTILLCCPQIKFCSCFDRKSCSDRGFKLYQQSSYTSDNMRWFSSSRRMFVSGLSVPRETGVSDLTVSKCWFVLISRRVGLVRLWRHWHWYWHWRYIHRQVMLHPCD